MEQNNLNAGILDMITQPAFTVKDGTIVQVNEAAQKYLLEPGIQIEDILLTGKREYAEFREGDLYLTVSIANLPCGTVVRRMDQLDVFTLQQETDQAELQAMALAAQGLRAPLSKVMTIADQLFPVTDAENPDAKDQIAQINRGLFQMLRVVSNMSDAYRYHQRGDSKMAMTNITGFLEEVFSKASDLLQYGERELHFENLDQPIFSLADREMLERAAHNMISNAVKFSPKGGRIDARLWRRNHMLYLMVQDNQEEPNENLRGNLYDRFLRRPGLEDQKFGIGLGMVMIREAAAAHGGTVLIDHPEGCGTRVTLSMTIRQNVDNMVRTSSLQVDYSGERDHALIELSDVLPNGLYTADMIN